MNESDTNLCKELPNGGLVATVGTVARPVNTVLVPVALALDTVQVGASMAQDYGKNTTRNTVESVAKVSGGWTGGYAGATGGALIGSAILPGIGTIIGGVAGAISGAIGGKKAAGAVVNKIGDECNYDIEEVKCRLCGDVFKFRKYQKNPEKYFCDDCKADRYRAFPN